ncbi:MAG: L,D-transpeptidase [Pegethrix bostrychoides GSE-TBD4-15B]|jgi:lipoprotein-anchoring transpeptidase ErfK/SrfK|uniref:L,D-transpeptidase n=1 Tax=Pegethrix bostrychoides GSE-TBD4-15B TaxID=2839662 RepID=A0A951P8W3_9CYAN|nr:L,D-transpeptidase [Pegethrix bostrychoides GSE-TBD4-15B]
MSRSQIRLALLTSLVLIGLQSSLIIQTAAALPEITPKITTRITPDLPNLRPSWPEPAVRLLLKLSERRVYLYQGEQLLADYPVAVGKPHWETPTGNFQVMVMQEHPAWQTPSFVPASEQGIVPAGDANNPMGERLILFWTDGKDYIGFHGTNQPDLIGQAVSHGCVRMRNQDIRKLYESVSIGTPVVVEP